MITPRHLMTARLVMSPVGGADLRDLVALKADPRAYAQMLGGVRSAQRTAEELAEEIQAWGEFGFGMWAVRERGGHKLLGVTGLMHRPDGRGVALRFALWPEARGVGLATEAVHAALVYAHDTAGLEKIVAVAREDNFASRIVLGAIGMWEVERFTRDGVILLVYNSVRRRNAG